MYKNSVVFLLCASVFGSSHCQESRKVASSYYGQLSVKLERNLTGDSWAFVQVKTAKLCLLYGQPGNGLRMTARVYAERMGAEWREVPFSVLLDGYRKVGATYIHDYFKAVQQEAKDRKVQIVLYVPDIDGNITAIDGITLDTLAVGAINPPVGLACFTLKVQEMSQQKQMRERQIAEIKPVLDLMRIELEELESKRGGDEGNVFVILSTHNLNDVDNSFLCHLEGSPVKVERYVEAALRIFHAHLVALADVRTLLGVYKVVREKLPKDSKALEVAVRIDELEALLHKHEELATSFWEQKRKNEKCWFNQTEYIKTKQDIVKLFTDVHDKACQVVKLSLAALKEDVGLSCTEREFYSVAKNFACVLRVSGYSAKELYKKEETTHELSDNARFINYTNRYFVTEAKKWRGIFEDEEAKMTLF